MMRAKTFELLIDLERNIQDEAEAREGYYRILKDYDELLTIEEINLLKEIIAEELKHTEILHQIIFNKNHIEPEP